ncbi:Hypothetical predicted protein [Mytilus galloprovincialis]|uniref:Ig-like domain-containing protein n=1 Tax=Mytilus galloprovincialis TaxID=29158 RepID=A0A8B6G8U3_MYTGA|nr:Hypothetical predicted protein [Mytilus galloprovincialis]
MISYGIENGKPDRIKRNTLNGDILQGGLNMVHHHPFNIYLKISWIKRLLANYSGGWQQLLLADLMQYWGENVPVSSKDFDIRLMITLMEYLDNLSISETPPSDNDNSEVACLSRIKYHNLKIQKKSEKRVSEKEFENDWTELSQAVIQLGGETYVKICNDVKNFHSSEQLQDEPVISGIQDYNIEAGRTPNVTPTVDAYPLPSSIWWTRQNDIKFIYYGLNLTIINIQERDSDKYTCHVMNTLTPSGLSAQNRTSKAVLSINAQKNSNSKVYESELDKPRQTSGVDNHLYNELQDLKSDGNQQNKSSERCSNTYEEFGEVKSSANDNIYENLKISTNEIQIRQKDTNLYVNLELKPSTKT